MRALRSSLALAALLAGVATLSSCGGETEARWTITDLGPGSAVDVNERGQVIGGGWLWEDGELTELGTLGGPSTSAAAINDEGQVIGGSTTARPVRAAGFLWEDGELTELGMGPRALNDSGQVVGGKTTADGREVAVLWEDGELTELGTLGGPSSLAVAINERGQIVGSAYTAETDANGQPIARAFLWEDGEMRDLGTLDGYAAGCGAVDVNERGQVVGWCSSATISYGQLGPGVHAFLWDDGELRDLGTLGGDPPTSVAVAIGDRGEVVGMSPATGDWRAFVWRDGGLTDLGTLGAGGHHTEAVAIDERGRVIGSTVPAGAGGTSHAFVWEDGTMTDLGTLGGSESGARAIAGDRIVGGSTTASGEGRAVLWTLERD